MLFSKLQQFGAKFEANFALFDPRNYYGRDGRNIWVETKVSYRRSRWMF